MTARDSSESGRAVRLAPGTGALPGAVPDELVALVERARAALSVGEVAEAGASLEAAARLLLAGPRPDGPGPEVIATLFCHLALRLRERGSPPGAAHAFGRALAIDARCAAGYATLVEVVDSASGVEAPEAAVDRVVAALPDERLALTLAAAHHAERGDHAAARRATEALLERDPCNERALLNLAAFALLTGELDAARRASLALLHIRPDSVEAHCNLAAVHEATGRDELAERQYREALRHAPGAWRPLDALGLLLLGKTEVEQHEQGVLLLERAVRSAPAGELGPLLNLALGYGQLGRRERALEAAGRVAARAPAGSALAAEAERFVEALRGA